MVVLLSFSMVALDRSCGSSRAQNCTRSQNLLLSPSLISSSGEASACPPRALLSLVLSVRVQSQRVLHNLAILDLGDLFLFLVPTVCLPVFSYAHPNPHFKCLMRKKKRRGDGVWVVTMEVSLNRLNLTTWMKRAIS